MKKLFLVILLITALLPISAKLYDEHSIDIAGLFIDPAYASKLNESSHMMKDLNYASYFCLDYTSAPQHQMKAPERMSSLASMGIMVPSLSSIATPGGPDHEKYTHLGWSHVYDDETMWKWVKRKRLLIDVVNKVFDFSALDNSLTNHYCEIENTKHPTQYSAIDKIFLSRGSKAVSMAAIIYYAHVLGDWEHNTSTTGNTRMPLNEIKEQLTIHLKRVFGSELKSYKELTLRLNNTSSSAAEILKFLQGALPGLLENEPFYKGTTFAEEVARVKEIKY